MSEHGKVSIVIPLYNVEEYIAECLNSLKEQTYQDYQVILVNDGSTDNTETCVTKLIADDSRYELLSISNHGPGYARNRGLEQATGAYLMFLDSDDRLANNGLELLVSAAEKQQADLVIGQTMRFDESKEWPVPSHNKHGIGTSGKKTILTNSELFYAIGPAAKLFRKEVIGKQLFSETKRFAEDQLLVFSAYMNAKQIYTISETVYYYRVRAGDNKSLTQTYRDNTLVNLKTILELMDEAKELLENRATSRDQLTNILIGYYNRLCEIELRVLFKANLKKNSNEQRQFYQLVNTYLNAHNGAKQLLQTPNFWNYLVSEQLTFSFLVKKESLQSYFEFLNKCYQSSAKLEKELKRCLEQQLSAEDRPVKQCVLNYKKIIKYGLKRVTRRKE